MYRTEIAVPHRLEASRKEELESTPLLRVRAGKPVTCHTILAVQSSWRYWWCWQLIPL